jgi:hypothetical protein
VVASTGNKLAPLRIGFGYNIRFIQCGGVGVERPHLFEANHVKLPLPSIADPPQRNEYDPD